MSAASPRDRTPTTPENCSPNIRPPRRRRQRAAGQVFVDARKRLVEIGFDLAATPCGRTLPRALPQRRPRARRQRAARQVCARRSSLKRTPPWSAKSSPPIPMTRPPWPTASTCATLSAHAAEAIEACRKASEERPEIAHYKALLARALYAAGQYDESVVLYRRGGRRRRRPRHGQSRPADGKRRPCPQRRQGRLRTLRQSGRTWQRRRGDRSRRGARRRQAADRKGCSARRGPAATGGQQRLGARHVRSGEARQSRRDAASGGRRPDALQAIGGDGRAPRFLRHRSLPRQRHRGRQTGPLGSARKPCSNASAAPKPRTA